MQEPRAQRTLVKSPPELWAEVSDVEALARHLGEFGDIRITRLDPETTVAWEGDRACGTVALEPSGWGTKVTITAKLAEETVAPEPVASDPEPEPTAPAAEAATVELEAAAPEPDASEPEAHAEAEAEAPKVGFFARLFGRRRKVEAIVQAEPDLEPVAVEPEPEPVATEPEPEPVAVQPDPEPVVAEPQPVPLDAERAEAILTGVLDDLGSAHHRPFSRS